MPKGIGYGPGYEGKTMEKEYKDKPMKRSKKKTARKKPYKKKMGQYMGKGLINSADNGY